MHAVKPERGELRCSECGGALEEQDLFCPWCGTPTTCAPQKTRRGPEGAPSPNADRGWTRTTSAIVATLSGLFLIAVLTIAGVYLGLRDRAAIERSAAATHLERGAAYLESGEAEMAAAELELAVRLAPDLSGAATLLARARTQIAAMPSVTPQPVTQEPPLSSLYEELVAAHARADWEGVWNLADRIRSLDASYRSEEIDGMLFDAYYASALDLVAQDRLPEAVRLLDRALELRPDDAEAQEQRMLAGTYMDGLARWDADWPGAIEKLWAVYLRDPEYHNVREKLHEAIVAYGDSLAAKGEWCAAQRQYAAALQIMDSTLVTAKHSEARERCEAGEGPLEPTARATARPGVFAGQLVEQTSIDEEKMLIRGSVLDASGNGIEGVRVRIEAFDWSSVAVTDLNGAFAFDGLRSPVTYTLSLPDLESQPVDVRGVFGRMSWVEFRQTGK